MMCRCEPRAASVPPYALPYRSSSRTTSSSSGRAHLQEDGVLQRLHAVHVTRVHGDALAHLHLEVLTVEVEPHPPLLQVERLLLHLVLLEREHVAGAHLEDLAGVPILVRVPDLPSPGLVDDLRGAEGGGHGGGWHGSGRAMGDGVTIRATAIAGPRWGDGRLHGQSCACRSAGLRRDRWPTDPGWRSRPRTPDPDPRTPAASAPSSRPAAGSGSRRRRGSPG
jgi:hypothetical protein